MYPDGHSLESPSMADDGGVLGNLPNSRPGKRSTKRETGAGKRPAGEDRGQAPRRSRKRTTAAKRGAPSDRRRVKPALRAEARREPVRRPTGSSRARPDPVGAAVRTAPGVAEAGVRSPAPSRARSFAGFRGPSCHRSDGARFLRAGDLACFEVCWPRAAWREAAPRCLIVDDHPVVRAGVRAVLEQAFDEAARSPTRPRSRRPREMVNGDPPDVVIVDPWRAGVRRRRGRQPARATR